MLEMENWRLPEVVSNVSWALYTNLRGLSIRGVCNCVGYKTEIKKFV
jgi:hypothetical protein